MKNYSYSTILEYIPQKYVGLSNKQMTDRQAVYSFKNGNCPEYAKKLLVDKINFTIRSNPIEWVVCFIPASSKSKHLKRYESLSVYLNSQLSCPVFIDGIEVAYDRESEHMTGKTGNPTENMLFNSSRFLGKKVVLIDDVRTRGLTFEMTADKLVKYGATNVYGIFLAQTIHPNLPIDTTRRGYYIDEFEDQIYDEIYQEQVQNEIDNEFFQEYVYNEVDEYELLSDMGIL